MGECSNIDKQGLYPWATRVVEYGSEVRVLGSKNFAPIAVTGPRAAEVIPLLHEWIATPLELRECRSHLAFVFAGNSIFHPPIMYSIFKVPDLCVTTGLEESN